MPAKKVKALPPTAPTPQVLAVNGFARNYLWPTIMGLVAALVTALAAGLPGLIIDGLQPEDWPVIAGILLAAGVGYLANILTRYGGQGAPWTDPPVE